PPHARPRLLSSLPTLRSSDLNVFVAGFIGSPAMNLGTFRIVDGAAVLGDVRMPLSRETISAMGNDEKGEIVVGFRPESLDRVSADRKCTRLNSSHVKISYAVF